MDGPNGNSKWPGVRKYVFIGPLARGAESGMTELQLQNQYP